MITQGHITANAIDETKDHRQIQEVFKEPKLTGPKEGSPHTCNSTSNREVYMYTDGKLHTYPPSATLMIHGIVTCALLLNILIVMEFHLDLI